MPKRKLTVVQIFRSGAVVEAKQDGANIILSTLWDSGYVPHDVLCGADCPDCSRGGFDDLGSDDDVLAPPDGAGGECGRRRDEGEGRKESREELHCERS